MVAAPAMIVITHLVKRDDGFYDLVDAETKEVLVAAKSYSICNEVQHGLLHSDALLWRRETAEIVRRLRDRA